METVFLGIGSNIGDSLKACIRAVRSLDGEIDCRVEAVSSWYRSEPWGDHAQSWFTNGALQLSTALSPGELLNRCKRIEERMGRRKKRRWGPRTIDLDILLWPGRLVISGQLVIPHPFLHRRRFVLEPLRDIAPDITHPGLGKTVSELLQTMEDPLAVHLIDSDWRFER